MAQTDELKRYAQQLAEYTLSQWNKARQRQLAREKGKQAEPQPSGFPPTSSGDGKINSDDDVLPIAPEEKGKT